MNILGIILTVFALIIVTNDYLTKDRFSKHLVWYYFVKRIVLGVWCGAFLPYMIGGPFHFICTHTEHSTRTMVCSWLSGVLVVALLAFIAFAGTEATKAMWKSAKEAAANDTDYEDTRA